jgi:hypothetical protein
MINNLFKISLWGLLDTNKVFNKIFISLSQDRKEEYIGFKVIKSFLINIFYPLYYIEPISICRETSPF